MSQILIADLKFCHSNLLNKNQVRGGLNGGVSGATAGSLAGITIANPKGIGAGEAAAIGAAEAAAIDGIAKTVAVAGTFAK